MQVFLFNYWYNVDTPFASAIENREYSSHGRRLALNDADPSNAVSKKCKHGVKTLVDTIVDQPCQYGNVVIM